MTDLTRVPDRDRILLALLEVTIIGDFESVVYVLSVIGIGDTIQSLRIISYGD